VISDGAAGLIGAFARRWCDSCPAAAPGPAAVA
jgi:hypothetical protein